MMFQFFAGTMFIATISIAVRMEERALLFSRVRSSESRFRQLVDRSIDVIFETDARGCWTFLNPSWEALTGRPVAWSIGTSFVEWIDEGQRASVLAEQRRLWAGEIEEARVELAFWHRDGTRRCAWIRCRLMVDEAGRPCGTWGTIHDITSRKAVEAAEAAATARILAMANTDDLTGIANRRHFLACLQDEVDRCRRNGSRFLLLMFDIDHFKQVNDTHGHATGDAVLKAVAAITVDVVRSTDTVARIGGEEFAILMPDTQMDDGRAVASRLLRALAGHELHGASGPVRVTVSIGLAQWTGSTSAEELMQAADKALYQAKHEGRNRLAAAA